MTEYIPWLGGRHFTRDPWTTAGASRSGSQVLALKHARDPTPERMNRQRIHACTDHFGAKSLTPTVCKKSLGSLPPGRALGPRVKRIRQSNKSEHGSVRPHTPGFFGIRVKARMNAISKAAPCPIPHPFDLAILIFPRSIDDFDPHSKDGRVISPISQRLANRGDFRHRH